MDLDTIIQTLSPALKLALLKSDDQEYLYDLEEKITHFLKDAQSEKLFLEPNLNSYLRMLSYNVAEYYKLRHILLKQENRLALYKQVGVDEENGNVHMIDESNKLKNLCKKKLAESLQMTEQEIAALNNSSDIVQQNPSQVVTKRRNSSPDLQQNNTSPTLSFFTMPSESTSSFTSSSMTSSLSLDNKNNSGNDRRSDSSMSSVVSEGKKATPKKSARKRSSATKKRNNNYSHNSKPRIHVHSQYNNEGYGQYWMGPQQQLVPQVYMYPSYAYVPETEYLAMGDDIEGEEFMEELADTPRASHPRYVPMPYMYGLPPSLHPPPPPHMGPHFQLMPVPFPPQYAAQPPMQFHPQYPFPHPPQPFVSEQNEELPPSC